MSDLIGQTIRSYEFREVIGRGGAATVYRAYQPLIEREVAVKVIHAEFANVPQFVRQFKLEAQLIARLEHPHIVPLYDYWREPDNAYLIMRLLRGGSLLNILKQHPTPLAEAARLFDQIASALAVAHRAAVIHQDIKPGNILLDEDKNAYLSDFGIARDLSISPEEHQVRRGTLAYMAPEQFMGQDTEITHHIDIYSMGVILYELIAGERAFKPSTETDIIRAKIQGKIPSVYSSRKDLPPGLDEIIQKATHKNPSERYHSILKVAEDFRQCITATAPEAPAKPAVPARKAASMDDRGEHTPPLGVMDPVNPFRGLRAFQEADARFFFGREKMVDQLIHRVSQFEPDYRFLAVVGPSGSGKSSVVKAGLIPALRQGAVPGSQDWFIIEMTPGAEPMKALHSALMDIALHKTDRAAKSLHASPDGLRQALDMMLPGKQETLLVIDQFEEVFTRVEDEDQRLLFIQTLIRGVTAPESHLRVIVTLRADFYDRPLFYGDLGEILRRRTEVILPMSAAELESAIVEPLARAGLQAGAGLVPALLADVQNQPGALPLMQYTLSELYIQRQGNILTLDAYRKSGGIQGALTNRATELTQTMSREMRDITRQIFLRLVTIEEGSEPTRRRISQRELLSMNVDRKTLQQILDRFSRHRLLTLDSDPVTGEPTVEIAHEALIRHWEVLKQWLDESRNDLRIQRQLNTAAEDWHQSKRSGSYLATGARLVQFETLLKDNRVALNQLETEFIEDSIEQRSKRQRLMRGVFVFSIFVALVMAGLAVIAFYQSEIATREKIRADEQARLARARELATTALLNKDNPDLALLLSLEADNIIRTAETRSSLVTLLQASPRLAALLHGQTEWIRTVDISPDGTRLAAAGRSNVIVLWDTATGQMTGQITTTHTDWINILRFSPDGQFLATGSRDRRVLLWDIATGAPTGELAKHTDEVWALAFSPDGTLLASGGLDGSIFLWDTATWELLEQPPVTHAGGVYSLAFSPNGKLLASGSGASEENLRLWRIGPGGQVVTAASLVLAMHSNVVSKVIFSTDGTKLISSGADGLVGVWSLGLQSITPTILRGHRGWVRGIALDSTGTLLASGDDTGQIRLWDLSAGANIATFNTLNNTEVWSLKFGSDHRLYSAGTEKRVSAWYTGSEQTLSTVLQTGGQPVLALMADSDRVVSVNGPISGGVVTSTIRVWNADGSYRDLTNAVNTDTPLIGAALSADGRYLVIADTTTIHIQDMASDTLITSFRLEDGVNTIASLALSPSGQYLAAGTDNGQVVFWRKTDSGYERLSNTGSGHTGRVQALAFNPDGTLLASASRDATIRLWDMATQQPVGEPLQRHNGGVEALAFSPDGTLLASGGRDSTIYLWDVTTRQPVETAFTGHRDRIASLAFSPSGLLLASGSMDNALILWDVATGRMLGTPLVAHTGRVSALAFSADGNSLWSGSFDGSLIRWRAGMDAWRQRACTIAGRNLTQSEWQRFLPDISYHPTCSMNEGISAP